MTLAERPVRIGSRIQYRSVAKPTTEKASPSWESAAAVSERYAWFDDLSFGS
jgi:hypothetical protein